MPQQINSTQIGQLAAQYAPDVPLELIGAVFKTESGYGRNPNAYVPNSSGAIGPGQILAKAFGAKYGNFEAYMPGGNPNDPTQSTIAALKKISADWKRSGDSIEKFSSLYFGAGQDAAGRTAQNHYIPKLLAAIKGQGEDQDYWKLVEGAMGGQGQIDTGTPSNTLSENRLQWMMDNGGPAKPNPSLSPISTYAEAAKSEADKLIDSIVAGHMKVADAKTEVARAEGNEKIELARKTEELLSAMGLNLKDSSSEIAQTADALQKAMAQLRGHQEKLNQDRQNPIFNIFDTVTKGRMSQIHNANIANSAGMVQNLSKSIQELQAVAQKQVALQPKVSESAIEKEIQAKAKVYQAEAELNGNKVGLQQAVRDERAQAQAELNDAKIKIQEAGLNLRQAQLEWAERKASLPKQLTVTEKLKVDSQKAEEEMFLDTAKAMGMTSEEYVKFLTKNKNLSAYMVGSDGRLPVPLVFAKASLGKLTPAQKKLFDSAYGQFSGWATPTGQNVNGIQGINYLPMSEDEMTQAEKSAKTPAEREVLRTAMMQAVAEKKKNFVLNTGSPRDEDVNPYVANFNRVAEMAKLPEFVRQNPIVDRVSKSLLYQTVQEKNAGNSPDKQGVADQEILGHAVQLVQSGKLKPADAAKQVSEYFKAQVAMNNYAKQFKELGLPEQDSYRIPVSTDGRVSIGFKTKEGKDGKSVPAYDMFDVTSEQKALAVIMMGNDRLMAVRYPILKLLSDFVK